MSCSAIRLVIIVSSVVSLCGGDVRSRSSWVISGKERSVKREWRSTPRCANSNGVVVVGVSQCVQGREVCSKWAGSAKRSVMEAVA